MSESDIRLFGIVVVYNPNNDVVKNIETYNKSLEQLYIVDNSDQETNHLKKYAAVTANCEYIYNNSNIGIAAALNKGANMAISNGGTWLLTMDQDSRFDSDGLKKLIQYVVSARLFKIGIVSPLHKTKITGMPSESTEFVETVMTSGNIVNLDAFQQIGGFDESYFIDAVDWEYCLRLGLAGFKVVRVNEVILEHELGNITFHKNIFGREIYTHNYGCIRRYYISRNKLRISKRYFFSYPKKVAGWILSFFQDFINVVFYENDSFLKLRYMMIGVYDFFVGKSGKRW